MLTVLAILSDGVLVAIMIAMFVVIYLLVRYITRTPRDYEPAEPADYWSRLAKQQTEMAKRALELYRQQRDFIAELRANDHGHIFGRDRQCRCGMQQRTYHSQVNIDNYFQQARLICPVGSYAPHKDRMMEER